MERQPPHGPLRAAIYARVRLEDALDLPKQGHALTAFAEQKGWCVIRKEHELAGRRLATLADDFDFTSEEGPRLMRIVRVLSAFQRSTHRDQVRSGLARSENPAGRPPSASAHLQEALELTAQGHSQREIARRLGIHPRTVARLLGKG